MGFQGRHHTPNHGGNLLLPVASVQNNRRFQVKDGMAALWKLFQHCDFGTCKGKGKRILYLLKCLELSNTCKEYGKGWKTNVENGIAALKYALWKVFGWGKCHGG